MTGQVIRVDFKAKKRLADNDAPPVAATPISPVNQQKLDFFGDIVQHSKTSTVCFPSHPGVQLPEHLMSQPQVMIDWSHKFGSVDFEYDEDGVRGTLRFNGDPCYVNIPWDAVFEIRNAVNPSVKQHWMPQQVRIVAPGPQLVDGLSPEKMAQLQQVLFSQISKLAQIKMVPIGPPEPKKEQNEPPIESTPGVVPGFVGRFFGKIRSFANSLFSKRVPEQQDIPGEKLDL